VKSDRRHKIVDWGTAQDGRSKSGSLAMFTAMRRALSPGYEMRRRFAASSSSK